MREIPCILGYRVLPNVGEPVTCYSWEEAVSVAEFFRQAVERQGIATTLESLTENYCIRNGSGVYARYDPPHSQIVIAVVFSGRASL